MNSNCDIKQIGKHRNGSPRYWCEEHKSIVIGNKNMVAIICEKSKIPLIREDEKLSIDPSEWKGGIGLWGFLSPVYNTSIYKGHDEIGVHVHARTLESGLKNIDATYKEIYVKAPNHDLFNASSWIKINAEIATAYTTSMVTGKTMKYLECNHCGEPHIDSDFFAVTYHKKHLCTYCGREFRDKTEGISNPVMRIRELLKDYIINQSISMVDRKLEIKQTDYPGGIEIWGSNPAIVWTAERSEEAGIHVHVYKNDRSGERVFDDTYGSVIIDGLELNDTQIRYLMVQNSLDHVKERVKHIVCPECSKSHFDTFDYAIRPHMHHLCEFCSHEFTTPKKSIGNPIINILKVLKNNYESSQKK